MPWGPNEFHSLNAAKFAERVKAETKGEVVMTTHPGGTLGVKANESLRSIGEGVVPMGDFALFQNASRGAVMAVETLPFLVGDYDQLKTMHKYFRPVWEGILQKNNQKALYLVPWPNQFFFVKKAVAGVDDLKGMKMRSLDKLTTDWINRLGMTPVQMTNLEILQALGSGMLDGVPTSAGTAVAQKYWDFMKFGYQTNHIWASNVMSINMDTWKKLSPAHPGRHREGGQGAGARVLGGQQAGPSKEGGRAQVQGHDHHRRTQGHDRRDGPPHQPAVGRVHQAHG